MNTDFGRDTSMTEWMEPLGFSRRCAGHRSGNGVQWPEKMAVCIGKVALGSREPILQTAVTPSVTAQDQGLSKTREARKGKTVPLARQALLPTSLRLCSFPVY